MTRDFWLIQQEQREWSSKNFGQSPSWHSLLGVQEEVGELSHAHLKREQGIRTNEDHTANIKDAIGDITIFLMDYCNREGLDFSKVVAETWNQVKQRDWKKNNKNGVVDDEF